MDLTDPVLQETTEKFAFHTVSYSYLAGCALVIIVALIQAIRLHRNPVETGEFRKKDKQEAAIIGWIGIIVVTVIGNTFSLTIGADFGPSHSIAASIAVAGLILVIALLQISRSLTSTFAAFAISGVLIGLTLVGPHHKVMVEVASDDAVTALKKNDAALITAIETSYDVAVETSGLHADCLAQTRPAMAEGKSYYVLPNTLTRHTCAVAELENAASGDTSKAPVVTVVTADDVLADYRVTYDPDTNTARLYADASAPAAPEPKQLAR